MLAVKNVIFFRLPAEAIVLFALALFTIVAPTRNAYGAPGDLIVDLGFPSASGIAAASDDGGMISAGTFFGSVDFGGGTLSSLGMFTPDVFVASWNAAGTHQWSFNVPHANGFGGVSVDAVVTDSSGSIYFGGRISDGDVDFGGGSLFGPNLYIVKLDSLGVHQWSSTYGDGNLNAIAISSAGLAVTGSTFGTVDFGGGSLATAGGADAFVAVLTVAGGHVFSAIHGDASNDQAGNDIGIDALGQVVVAGGMQGSVDFGGGVPLASAGQADIYVARYDGATGAHQWSSVLGSATSEIVNDLSQDGGGNLVISGNMSGSFDAGGGALPFDTFSDLFVVSLDSSGNHQWSAGFGTAGFDYFAGNAVDGSGNVLLFGGAGNGIDFGAGALADASLYLARFVPEPDLASMILVGTIFLGCVSRSTAGRGVTVDRPS